MDIILPMKATSPDDLIQRVKDAMKLRGYTSIMSLAKEAEIGESFIRSAEKKGTYLSTPVLQALSKTLRVPVGYFFGEVSITECSEPVRPAFGEQIAVVQAVTARYADGAVVACWDTDLGTQEMLLSDSMTALAVRRLDGAFRGFEQADVDAGFPAKEKQAERS